MQARRCVPTTISIFLAVFAGATAGADEDVEALARAANLALECAHQEYPNKIAHVMSSDADVKPPRELTPAFFGCFDWHSAVHGHWLLARLAHRHPDHPLAPLAKEALARSLTSEHIAVEVEYFRTAGRASFERPYGLAWLLQLGAELREWNDPDASRWSAALDPLEREIANRLSSWLGKLVYPIRVGEHSQTAFAFGLIHDWARAHDPDLAALVEAKSRAFYASDRDCPLSYEPGGQDFLSPCLAEADLMRRFLPPATYAAWLGGFLPGVPLEGGAGWLPVARVTDRTDGKLAHLDGLNLARAWMLEGIAAGLPTDDPRRGALAAAEEAHADSGLASLRDPHYAGGHWLGSFAAYLLTGRGLPETAASSPGGGSIDATDDP